MSEAKKQQLLERGYGETRVRVRYAETDAMGVVYHANYLVWFEVGRVEWLRQMGICYRDMQDAGVMIAVVEATARYKASAKYDDDLVVRTWLTQVRGSIVRFKYAVLRDAVVLCEGETVHLAVGADFKKCKVPEELMAVFAQTDKNKLSS